MGNRRRNSPWVTRSLNKPVRFTAGKRKLQRGICRLAVAGAAFGITIAVAAEYPARPIRFVVPFAAGGGPDVTARLLAIELGQQMGQQFVIDNRAGAGGSIGTEMIVRAAADGYTIGYGSISTLAINRSLLAKLPYDSDRDLQKIVQTYSAPNMMAATLLLPVKSVQELIAYAKSNPGKLTFGSNGNATSPHLSGELFKHMTGTQMVHVPYKAGQQVVTDMIGGQLDLTFNNVGLILPHVKAGRLRGLGVTSLKRLPAIPELPTVAESGVPGFEVTAWAGMVVPVGVPKAIVARLNAEIDKALASPVLREKYAALGYDVAGGTPVQFDNFVKTEIVKWADVIKRSGTKIE